MVLFEPLASLASTNNMLVSVLSVSASWFAAYPQCLPGQSLDVSVLLGLDAQPDLLFIKGVTRDIPLSRLRQLVAEHWGRDLTEVYIFERKCVYHRRFRFD